MDNKERGSIIARYQKTLDKYGVSPKALRWHSEEAEEIRHKILSQGLKLDTKTVLDAGCGFGDLYARLKQVSRSFDYTGIDLVADFIKIARRNHPDANFIIGSPLEDGFVQTFDIVICSGMLNSGREDNWEERRKQAILKLYSLANDTFAFNTTISESPSYTKRGIGYINAEDILSFCHSICSSVALDKSYHQKDYTIFMHKK